MKDALRPRAILLLKAVYVAAVIGGLGWAVHDVSDLKRGTISLIQAPEACLFVLAWLVMACLLGRLWVLWLQWRFDVELSAREWLPLQALAWAGRYLPGKVGLLAGKLSLAQDPRLGWKAVSQSVLVEQLAFVFAGAALGAVLLATSALHALLWLPSWIVVHWEWLRLATGAGLGLGFVLAVALIERVSASAMPNRPAEYLRVAALLMLYTLPHVLIGAAFFQLLPAFSGAAASIGLLHAIAVLALAHVAGALAIFAPAGLGVRELVLATGLVSATVPVDQSLLIAAVLRLLTLIADGALLAGLASHWLWRRCARAG
ncbi:hypothetical protein [Lysobacter sp. D1-1-M9]|uniref:hypothetical protein n=1 Tax=Novilysobacter longmucuonensis TaxID=3098603 RepID=UPI002FC6469B